MGSRENHPFADALLSYSVKRGDLHDLAPCTVISAHTGDGRTISGLFAPVGQMVF